MRKINVVDAVNDCVCVLAFLSEVFGTLPAPSPLQLTHTAQSGVSLILDDLSNRLSASVDALANNKKEMEVF